MKTISTLLLLAITLFVYSQMPLKFILDNTTDVRNLSDSIALNAKRTYIFSNQYSVGANGYEVLYNNKSDSTDNMCVKFYVRMKGANSDLEISGIPEYVFYNVSGKYLDLFPFWKRFVNSNDNIDELAMKGASYRIIDNNRLLFSRNSSNIWVLSLKK